MSIGMDTASSVSMASCSCRPTNTEIPPSFSVFALSSASVSSDESTICSTDLIDDDNSIASLDIDIDDADLSGFKLSMCPVTIPETEQILPGSSSHTLPPVITALHQFELDLRVLKISAIDHYHALSLNTVELARDLPPRGHVDGGALANTTDRLSYLWSYHRCTPAERKRLPRLQVADDTIHVPHGYGYIKVPCAESPGYLFMLCFYTPQIPATIISPDRLGRSLSCRGYHTYSDFVDDIAVLELTGCDSGVPEVHIDLQRIRGLLFTESLIAPSAAEHSSTSPPDFGRIQSDLTSSVGMPSTRPVRAMSLTTQRDLWHMRLGHMNSRMVSEMHKHAKGIPKLPRTDAIDHCPICTRSKLHKSNRGPLTDHPCTTCWEQIQVDFGFFVVQSSGRKPRDTTSATPKRSKMRSIHTAAPKRRQSPRLLAQQATQAALSPHVTPPESPLPGSSDPIDSSASTSPDHAESASPAVPPPSPSDLMSASDQHYTFERILAHQGPLDPSDSRRISAARWNLKILWSTQETTWEPYDRVFADAPHEVVEYARSQNLLDNPDWHFVRDAAIAESPPGTHRDDFDDETELVDTTLFAPGTTVTDPVDESVAAAKAHAATTRYRRLQGLNGETCYVLITCVYSGACKVSIRRDKTPPMDFFREFLSRYGSASPRRSVRFDLGGELGRNQAVHDLFSEAGYEVEVTTPDSSNEIGMVERPHRTIADAVRTMLHAADLPPKFWPYALRYWLLISDCVPHGSRPASPKYLCTGELPNLSLLRIFGCRIYALPPTQRDAKVDVHARSGIFLGYQRSMRHAFYYDLESKQVKTSRHVAFDEGMQDLRTPPPFVHQLRGTVPPTQVHLDDATRDMQISLSPFTHVVEHTLSFRPGSPHPLGFQMERCPRYLRAYVSAFTRAFGSHSVAVANRRFLGSYILKVGKFFTFTPDHVRDAIHFYSTQATPPTSLIVRFAVDQRVRDLSDSRGPALHLRPLDLRRIAALPLVAGEGNAQQQRSFLRDFAHGMHSGCTPADPDDLEHIHDPAVLLHMRKLQNDHMTPEERALPSLSRKNCMTLPNWSVWQASDDKQLDAHFDAGTIGMAVDRPATEAGKPSHVFRIVWARLVKATGVRKSRACLDGSKRAAPWLRALVQTYSSCVELPCMRLFIALCVNRNYYICFGDVDNAFQQAPPPTHQCYLEIDDTVYDWYLRRFGIKLDRRKQVIPLYKALQGFPEAGALWERMINDILLNKMGFRLTTHERNLYIGEIDGQEVLVCRQVDDFASGAACEATAKKFMDILRSHVESEYHGMGIPSAKGVYERYNGVDVYQTAGYVKLGCDTYLSRVFQTHGWDSPKSTKPDPTQPMAASSAEYLQRLEGPAEKSAEAKALEKQHGFSYRNLLGELMYAYVLCRLDISFAICFLARFSTSPHSAHFTALRHVCKYLRAHKDWGIIYHRPFPLPDLPRVPLVLLDQDPNLPAFPAFSRHQLVGVLDAAHATDFRTRRSVTGLIIIFCGAAIAYKSRLQSLVATSSTEAEFYAAVFCAKLAKYFRYVLQELNGLTEGPTPLYIDNEAALNVINERRPTPRARHVEIQHFAIQEWRAAGDIIMRHLPGVINSSDALTKAVTTVLHHRHTRRAMGHYQLVSEDVFNAPLILPHVPAIEAGEGVGANSDSIHELDPVAEHLPRPADKQVVIPSTE